MYDSMLYRNHPLLSNYVHNLIVCSGDPAQSFSRTPLYLASRIWKLENSEQRSHSDHQCLGFLLSVKKQSCMTISIFLVMLLPSKMPIATSLMPRWQCHAPPTDVIIICDYVRKRYKALSLELQSQNITMRQISEFRENLALFSRALGHGHKKVSYPHLEQSFG